MNTNQVERRIRTIVQQQGRRPRVLLAHLETDQSDQWSKPLAAFLAEFGFDVDIGPGSHAPLQTARLAVDNDVHMICVSIVDIANQALVVDLAEALRAEGGEDIRLVVGDKGLQVNHREWSRAGVDLAADFDKLDIHLIDGLLDLIVDHGKKRRP